MLLCVYTLKSYKYSLKTRSYFISTELFNDNIFFYFTLHCSSWNLLYILSVSDVKNSLLLNLPR